MYIKISVNNKIATLQDNVLIVNGNSDYVIKFDFDSEWDAYETKTARFMTARGYTDVVFSGDEVALPVIQNERYIRIGVYAGDLRTTTSAVIFCRRCITDGSGSPADPTPDVYAQLMALLNDRIGIWYPTVDDAGNMSWVRSMAETEPTPINIKGPIGETGAQGAQGEKGPKGDKGDTGAQGPKGDTGDTGPTGPEGPQGPKGDAGPAGVPGKDGAPGIYYGTTQPTGDTHPVWIDPNGDHDDGGLLPAVTAADNGKVLRVVSGAWAPVDMPTGGGGSSGGIGELRRIAKVTLTEDAASIEITTDEDGNAFELVEYTYLIIGKSLGTTGNVGLKINDTLIYYASELSSSNTTATLHSGGHGSYTGGWYATYKYPYNASKTGPVQSACVHNIGKMTKFWYGCTNGAAGVGFQAGTVLELWGR